MNYLAITLLVSLSVSSQGYVFKPRPILPYQMPMMPLLYAKDCLRPPCTEPVRVEDPHQAGLDYECKSAGYFPDPESGCQKFFQCVQQGDSLRVSGCYVEFNHISLLLIISYQAFQFDCGPDLLFDTKIGSCNHEEHVLDC